jgi:soluble lytic murein transglycosylase-like protein
VSATTLRDSTDARLELARGLRDAGDHREALAAYAEVDLAMPGRAPEARWERARLLEERGDWMAAREDYGLVVAADVERSEHAALRAGLMSISAGDPAVALEWFARRDSEGTRFWRGVVLRALGRSGGDSLLRAVAARPGYGFYRSAARDTLGMFAWPGFAPAAHPSGTQPVNRLARTLDALGCGADAAFLMDRWYAHDPRVFRNEMRPGLFLDAAAVAYAAARPRQAIRFVDRGLSRVMAGPDSLRWSISPWLYPPAYDSLFAAWPESAAAGRIDRALLQAVAWKESHFDPRARSRSDAVGLLQLKRPAVTDVARWLREKAPSDSALADPALNLRYGAEYLQRQLTRFKGDLPLALAAYNAGPTVAKRWTRLRALGGDALACEEIDFPETQDYVKTILAVRQAYRELRPTLAP